MPARPRAATLPADLRAPSFIETSSCACPGARASSGSCRPYDGGMDVSQRSAGFPASRPRRLRRTAAVRELVAETHLSVGDLVAPLFVREGIDEPQPIVSLPGVV